MITPSSPRQETRSILISISKQLVELMGGKIWVESEEGKGSKFIFEIPLKKGKELEIKEKQKGEETNIQILKNSNILVVEDNKINQEIIDKLSYAAM